MRQIIRGLAILLSGILLFIFIVSCTPGVSFGKRDNSSSRTDNENLDERDFNEENNDFGDENVNARSNSRRNSNYDEDIDGALYKRKRFYQTGMASWYGREFHGKVTASGEKFNMYELTAAHRTLPFGTIVEIKNFDNGKTVTARINDRGPYRGKRIIDLSYNAAKRIKMIASGKTHVGIKILKKGKGRSGNNINGNRNGDVEPVSDDTIDGDSYDNMRSNYSLQVGAFYSKRNADNLKKRVEYLTDNSVVIIHENDMYKVRLEGIMSKRDLNRFKRILSEEEISSYVINNKE